MSRKPRWVLALAATVVVVVAGGVVSLGTGGSSSGRDQTPAWARDGEVPNALHEAADEARQAKFDRGHGKEGDRRGPIEPSRGAGRQPRLPARLRRRPSGAQGAPCFQTPSPAAPASPAPQQARAAPERLDRTGPADPQRRRPGLTVHRSGNRRRAFHPGVGPGHGARHRPQLRNHPRRLPNVGCRRGRRHLAHQRRPGHSCRMDRATRRPADQLLRLALLRRRHRSALRRLRGAQRLQRLRSRVGPVRIDRLRRQLDPGAGQRCGRHQPLDRRDRRRPQRTRNDLHRHRRRPPRLLLGQRRAVHAAECTSARRLPIN